MTNTTFPSRTKTVDAGRLKLLVEACKGWNLTECWPEETKDGDLEVNWFVGNVTEDGDKYPVIEVNTAQYDAFEGAGHLARLIAATNPAAVLALIAENDRLEADTATLEFVRHTCKVNEAAIKHAGHETIDGLAQERDQLKAMNEALRKSLEGLIHISNATNWEQHTCGEIGKARNLLGSTGQG